MSDAVWYVRKVGDLSSGLQIQASSAAEAAKLYVAERMAPRNPPTSFSIEVRGAGSQADAPASWTTYEVGVELVLRYRSRLAGSRQWS